MHKTEPGMETAQEKKKGKKKHTLSIFFPEVMRDSLFLRDPFFLSTENGSFPKRQDPAAEASSPRNLQKPGDSRE